jgi:spore coat polysaccharide biosynthesis predicted glycosyltransferase SpsG
MMKVALREDANGQMGTGHIFRCLSIAAELKNKVLIAIS